MLDFVLTSLFEVILVLDVVLTSLFEVILVLDVVLTSLFEVILVLDVVLVLVVTFCSELLVDEDNVLFCFAATSTFAVN